MNNYPDFLIYNASVFWGKVTILYSKDSTWALVYTVFKAGFSKGEESSWAIVLKKVKIKDKKTEWQIFKMEGRSH